MEHGAVTMHEGPHSNAGEGRRDGRALGLRGRLILSIGAVAMLTLVAGGFGLWSYQGIQTAFRDVTENSIPVMADAFEVADRTSSLTFQATALVAATTSDKHAETKRQIAADKQEIAALFQRLASSSLPLEEVRSAEALEAELVGSLVDLDRMVSERLALADDRRQVVKRAEKAHDALIAWLAPKIDDANFELVIRAEETTSGLGEQIETLMTDGVGRLQAGLELRAEANQMAGILIEAVVLRDPAALAAAEDRFIAVANTVEEQTALLADLEGGEELRLQIDAMRSLGQGDDGIFAERRRLLAGNSDAIVEDGTLDDDRDSGAWTKAIFGPREAILAALEPIVDEARFDLVLLSEDSINEGSQTINQLIDQSVSSLRAYLGIAADANWLVGLLHQASKEQDPAALSTLVEQIDSAIGSLQGYRDTDGFDPTLTGELDQFMTPLLEPSVGAGSIPDLRAKEIDLDRQQRLQVEAISTLAAKVGMAAARLIDFARSEVEANSATVEAAIWKGRWLLAVLSAAALAGAAAVVIFYVGPRIVDPIRSMTSSISRLAQGEQVVIQGRDRSDELGELARSLTVIHETAVESSRIKLALDTADVGVMVADAGHGIVYVNHRLRTMFEAAEAEIQRAAPAFSVDRIIGASFDSFSEDIGCKPGLLDGISNAHRTELQAGGRDFAIVVSPVLGVHGEHLGAVIEWADLTDERRLQAAIDDVVNAAGAGDFSRRIDVSTVDGSMTRLAGGINHLTDLVEGATRDLGAMLSALAAGDLTQRITADYEGALGLLKDDANQTAEQLAKIVTAIQDASSEVQNAALEITSGTEDLSHRTEQAASNLEETAAATDEMAATVNNNAENAKNASELAQGTNDSAATGGQVVERAVDAMAQIEQSAKKITDIISVIDEIAFQTNLLALNASVEAARAGEAGKGFAVVAQEVRQLAQRSATAADDIKVLIKDSNDQVENGVNLVNQAGEALSKIVGSIGQVAEIVTDISRASQEQATGVREINGSITSMDEMTQQNSALVEESTAAARALTDQAGKLGELMDFFKLEGAQPSGRPKARGANSSETVHPPLISLASSASALGSR